MEEGGTAAGTVANKACTQLYAEHCILWGACVFRFTSAMTMLQGAMSVAGGEVKKEQRARHNGSGSERSERV